MAEERVQRRLAAILAADVVGYSRLMATDEPGTLAALKARRRNVLDPLAARHQGRIFKTAGDGVLVEFASAVNAVQCAVELQQSMAEANNEIPEDRRIVLRIGINLGDVMVEGGDLYGDCVNIAARLEALADPGDILVSGTAYDYVRNKVKVGFDDLGAQLLKNIAESIHVHRIAGASAVTAAAATTNAEKPSIAILPFANISGDSQQEYFSDGITEDIITELSRFTSLSVVARNASFQFRNKSPDISKVGRQLGARYIVEGSVRRIGPRIRITAQLTDALASRHLWAERYDGSLDELFTMQDEVVRAVVVALVRRVEDTEIQAGSRKPPQNWAAYDYMLKARGQMSYGEDWLSVENLLRRAIALDPSLSEAHSLLVYILIEKFWRDGAQELLEELSSSPDSHRAQCQWQRTAICHGLSLFIYEELRCRWPLL
jgi:TolB-like protein